MDSGDLVLVRGMRSTRATLAAWNRNPLPVLVPWVAGAAAIAVLLLLAVWVVATLSVPDPSRLQFAGVTRPARPDDVTRILLGNSLVLALHAFACVAGFIAGSSLPLEAERYSGFWRRVHDKAGSRRRPWRRSGASRRRCCSRACCRTPCPSSPRCSCRSPLG
jgi:hypothetical protein